MAQRNYNRGRTVAQRARYAAQVERNRARYAKQQAEREASERAKIAAEDAKRERQSRKVEERRAKEHARYLARKAKAEAQIPTIVEGADALNNLYNEIEGWVNFSGSSEGAAYEHENAAIVRDLLSAAVQKYSHKITYINLSAEVVGKWEVWRRIEKVFHSNVVQSFEDWVQGVYDPKYSQWGSTVGRANWEKWLLDLRVALDMEDWSWEFGVGSEINWDVIDYGDLPDDIAAELFSDEWV